LLRKFAEGQSAGEFYTPKEVGDLIAESLNPRPRTRIHDPACGSCGLLIKAWHLFEVRHPEDRSRAPQLYGQEWNPTTYAMAKMNLFLHGYIGVTIAVDNTMRNPMLGWASLIMSSLIPCGISMSNTRTDMIGGYPIIMVSINC
jgi:type I restriction enzyme M protein